MSKAQHTPGPWYWNRGMHDDPDPRKREPRTICSRTAKSPVDGTDMHVLIPCAKMTSEQALAVKGIELVIVARPNDEALIAAAPDLLEACEMLVALEEASAPDKGVCYCGCGASGRDDCADNCPVRMARAAIAKASGK